MTDEEILRRLAEVEGWEKRIELRDSENMGLHWVKDHEYQNPLTDDAQCLALVKKYDADISSDKRYANAMWTVVVYSNEAKSRSLNRAVCLAIIEAHK